MFTSIYIQIEKWKRGLKRRRIESDSSFSSETDDNERLVIRECPTCKKVCANKNYDYKSLDLQLFEKNWSQTTYRYVSLASSLFKRLITTLTYGSTHLQNSHDTSNIRMQVWKDASIATTLVL